MRRATYFALLLSGCAVAPPAPVTAPAEGLLRMIVEVSGME